MKLLIKLKINLYEYLTPPRNQSVESLEFFYFLQELFLSLVGEYGKSTNPLILDFLKVIEGFY